jgi:hypothetical protein
MIVKTNKKQDPFNHFTIIHTTTLRLINCLGYIQHTYTHTHTLVGPKANPHSHKINAVKSYCALTKKT